MITKTKFLDFIILGLLPRLIPIRRCYMRPDITSEIEINGESRHEASKILNDLKGE